MKEVRLDVVNFSKLYSTELFSRLTFPKTDTFSYLQLPSVTFSYFQLPPVTFSYFQLLSVTSSYLQLLPVTTSYFQLLSGPLGYLFFSEFAPNSEITKNFGRSFETSGSREKVSRARGRPIISTKNRSAAAAATSGSYGRMQRLVILNGLQAVRIFIRVQVPRLLLLLLLLF